MFIHFYGRPFYGHLSFLTLSCSTDIANLPHLLPDKCPNFKIYVIGVLMRAEITVNLVNELLFLESSSLKRLI